MARHRRETVPALTSVGGPCRAEIRQGSWWKHFGGRIIDSLVWIFNQRCRLLQYRTRSSVLNPSCDY